MDPHGLGRDRVLLDVLGEVVDEDLAVDGARVDHGLKVPRFDGILLRDDLDEAAGVGRGGQGVEVLQGLVVRAIQGVRIEEDLVPGKKMKEIGKVY